MFLTNADSLLDIGVVSLIIRICILLLVAILVGYLFNYTLIKEIKKLTTLTAKIVRVESALPADMTALAEAENLLQGWTLTQLPCE